MSPRPPSPFGAAFARWAARVRRRLAARHVLTGAALGLAVGAAASAGAWAAGIGPARPLGAALGVVGGIGGALMARRRRWPDGHVALYLDARLGSEEAIATALELQETSERGAARAVVVERASTALAGATPQRVRPRVLRAVHAALPLGAAAIVWLSVRPLPPRDGAGPPPGAEQVKMLDVRGLEKVEKLGQLDGRDEAQRERLKQLAEEAKRLREKLAAGVEKREAQADIAKIRDGITAERLSFGDAEQRQGLEAAASQLAANPETKRAEKALGDCDLTSFDEEMERLANRLEKQDRERVKKTLEEAAEAAKKNGAKDVAKELERQKDLLDERGQKADRLRELARELGGALGEEGKQALQDWNGSGSRKDLRRLEQRMEEALGKLGDAERKQLAENLKKKVAKMGEADGEGDDRGPSKEQLRELAEMLETPEGQKRLEEELRRMAGDDESRRQDALDDAQEGAGEAEGMINGKPIPIPLAGPGGKPGKGSGGDGDGAPSPGHSEDPPSDADHHGMTGVVEGGEVKSRANAKMNAGKPMPGVVMGRTTGRAGETANVEGAGALGRVGPREVGGIERSDVPEEYREQVGRYFQPK